ncbi:MAG: hypothetical protein Q9174_002108 [Haloplaca sp. 1 TL-2023]
MHITGFTLVGLLPLFTHLITASPFVGGNIAERNLPPVECAKVTKVIRNPPATKEKRHAEALIESPIEERDVPGYLKGVVSSVISSACRCFDLPPITATSTKVSTTTITTQVASTITKTVYPCASPVPSKIPTIPFGRASSPPSIPGTQNALYGQGTYGSTLGGCCNLCYFLLPNCLNAFYYDYQGCVVQTPTEVIGTGPGVSDVCPNGQIAGLTYSPEKLSLREMTAHDLKPGFPKGGVSMGAVLAWQPYRLSPPPHAVAEQ